LPLKNSLRPVCVTAVTHNAIVHHYVKPYARQ
jgi:hypothetical protein